MDRTERRFSLKLNNRPFTDLPEESMLNTAVIAEEGSSVLRGIVEFNGVSLLKGEMNWSIQAMHKLLRRKLRGKTIVTVRLNRIS